MNNGRIAMSLLLWALFIATGKGQTLIDLRTQTKSVDFSGAGSTKPIKTGSSLPAACASGEVFFLTSAPSGSNVYGCNPANVWTLEGANLGINSGVTNKLLSNNGSSIQWVGLAGDISGLPDGLMVTGIQGRAVANTAPTDGQALVWNAAGSTWKPAALAGGITSVFGRTGAVTAQTGDYAFSQIAGTASTSQLPAGINAANIGSGTVNNTKFGYLANLASDVQTQLNGKAPLSGDLGGTTSAATVTGIQNRAVANTAPNDGQALVWNAAASQWKPSNVSGGGAGASMASQLGDLAPVRTSATVLTIGANCSSATPCNFRFGTQTFSITTSATATISGSGTGIAYIYATGSGALVVGHNLTVACSAACTQQPGVTSFPANSIPLYTWTATAGTWDAGGGRDQRAFLSAKTLLGGTGIEVTETAGQTMVAVDTAAVELQANKGAASGYAPLDAASKVPLANLPGASGDVTGALSATVVTRLQGRALSATAPTDGQALVWSNANSAWQPGSVAGGAAKAQPLFGSWNPGAGLGVAAGTTQYFALNSVATNAAESRMAVPVPVAGTLSAWYLRTVSSQPSDNSMTCSVRVNLATPANTLSITIPPSQAPGVLSDLANSVHVNAGDTWDIMCVNASAGTSAYMTLVSFKLLPD
jgi:hypothetical protein